MAESYTCRIFKFERDDTLFDIALTFVINKKNTATNGRKIPANLFCCLCAMQIP